MDPVQAFFFFPLQAEVGVGWETLVAPGPTQRRPFEVGGKWPCLLSFFSMEVLELRRISLTFFILRSGSHLCVRKNIGTAASFNLIPNTVGSGYPLHPTPDFPGYNLQNTLPFGPEWTLPCGWQHQESPGDMEAALACVKALWLVLTLDHI